MLSNKLTFSLVFVLALALIAGPALAQTKTLSGTLNNATTQLGSRSFVVLEMENGAGAEAVTSENGILDASDTPVRTVNSGNFPDLDQLLKFGGTIELLVRDTAATGAQTYATRQLVITEIMWGLNQIDASTAGSPGPGNIATSVSQWIEVYNERADDLASTAELRLLFTANVREANSRVGKTVALNGAAAPAAAAEPAAAGGTVYERTDTTSHTYTVVDSVWITSPKGNGGRSIVGANDEPIVPLVSMYRKRSLSNNGEMYRYDGNNAPTGDKFANGQDAGQWIESKANARINIQGQGFVGTPGSVHLDVIGGGDRVLGKAAVDAVDNGGTGIIINEVRNDTSQDNVDWIELYNNSAVTADPISVRNYTLSMVTANGTGTDNISVVAQITLDQDYQMPPRSYLLIVNKDPEDTILAGGVDLVNRDDEREVKKGARHVYYIDRRLDLPSDKNFSLVLRTNGATNGTDNFVDFVGTAFYTDADRDSTFRPLQGWGAPGDHRVADTNHRDLGGTADSFASRDMSYGRISELRADGLYHSKSRGSRLHHEDWADNGFGYMGGIGYDLIHDEDDAPGTPGYANHSNPNYVFDDKGNQSGTDDYTFSGSITISEIMYDAGPRWNLVQWIELYNSSFTEAIDIAGWTLEIRNLENPNEVEPQVDSFVDSIITFDADTVILPNQTLLIVSGSAANEKAARPFPDSQVYNLFQRHRRDLGLDNRANVLLSNYGIYLQLTARSRSNQDGWVNVDEVQDRVGNITIEQARRNHMWDLPEREASGVRSSIVRTYGGVFKQAGFERGTGPHAALDGTMEDAWRRAAPEGAGHAFYGHHSDISTPGHRLGGALPVSLSSFRPVRDKATGEVVIRWITESELNNAGFNILRSETKTGEFTVVNVKGLIAGHGTTSEKHTYEWKDTTAKPNVVYYYQIEDVSLDGNRTTLATTHLRGNVNAAGKVTTTWGDLKTQ